MLYRTKFCKIYKIIIILFITSLLNAESFKYYNIEFKDKSKQVYKVVNITTEYTIVLDKGKKKKLHNSYIKKHVLVNKNDYKFKRVILLTEKNYVKGYIIYQDREKLSVTLNMDESILFSIKFKNVLDIVNADVFDYEMSKSKYSALKYSLLLPGLGQFYTSDRIGKGIFFLSSFLILGSSGVFAYKQGKNYYDQYKQSKYKETKYYKKYKTYTYAGYGLLGATALVYVWNVLDSYFNFKHKYALSNKNISFGFNFDKEVKLSIAMRI